MTAGSGDKERSAAFSSLLAGLTLLAALATIAVGALAAPVALVAVGSLVAYTLDSFGEHAPRLPKPRLSLAWLRELADFLLSFVAWAAPQLPFLVPLVVFVVVTWPLPRESAPTMRFQEQASQIILVLLIGYVIEAGAIRWRSRRVNWVLSLITAGILLTGEVYALVDLATDNPDHADIIAGSMAAGVAAILIAAIQGSSKGGAGAASDGDDPPTGPPSG